jgi:hypothetical protein
MSRSASETSVSTARMAVTIFLSAHRPGPNAPPFARAENIAEKPGGVPL